MLADIVGQVVIDSVEDFPSSKTKFRCISRLLGCAIRVREAAATPQVQPCLVAISGELISIIRDRKQDSVMPSSNT